MERPRVLLDPKSFRHGTGELGDAIGRKKLGERQSALGLYNGNFKKDESGGIFAAHDLGRSKGK